RPYVLASNDRGRSWRSIRGDLPERGTVYTLAQDHVDPALLFAGTEFGVFFTGDAGRRWIQLTGGLPTIAARELEIQRRENDLVVASFGRGFFVLDDYSPLRHIAARIRADEAILFDVKDAWMYMETHRLGIGGKGFQGEQFFTADNPPFGAIFTYYLPETLETGRQRRRKEEKSQRDGHEPIAYPGWETLRAEDREEPPAMVLTVRDAEGQVVRRLNGPVTAGFHRVAWDLRFPALVPTRLTPRVSAPWDPGPTGPMASPGRYTVSLSSRVDDRDEVLSDGRTFDAEAIGAAALPAADRQRLLAFEQKTGRLQRAVLGTTRAIAQAQERIDHLQAAWLATPGASPDLGARLRAIELALADLRDTLMGDSTVASRHEPTPPSIVGRVQRIVSGHWSSTSAPTATHRRNYEIAATAFAALLPRFRSLMETDLADVEEKMEAAGAPWTPGRIPRWKPE
ncbi:MAG: glycosyl hydrolase, partial [Acidobacteriota bacterium]